MTRCLQCMGSEAVRRPENTGLVVRRAGDEGRGDGGRKDGGPDGGVVILLDIIA